MRVERRLSALKHKGEITEHEYSIIKRIQYRLLDKWLVDISTEQSYFFISHLAGAFSRVRRGVCTMPMNQKVYGDLQHRICFFKAQQIYQDILTFAPYDLPIYEQEYCLARLCFLCAEQPQIKLLD